jgi:RHS repeat-associated protein
MPSDSRENGDYLTSFNGSAFTDRYGTTIYFYGTPVIQHITTQRYGDGGYQKFVYTPALYIYDRFGNALQYSYPANATTLIPSEITLVGHPDQTLYIRQDGSGHITQIWDPNGNLFQYQYTTQPYSYGGQAYDETLLSSVTGPGGGITRYTYDFAVEADQTPSDVTNNSPSDKYHIDVNSIQDPLGNKYSFSYLFDETKWDSDTKNSSYYPETGAPRNVHGITLPGGMGGVTLTNNSNVKLTFNANGQPQIAPGSIRQNSVTDAAGSQVVYSFTNASVFNVGGLDPNTPAFAVPKVVFYGQMNISYGGRGETLNFDPTAGLALSSVTDYSGNTTSYTYGDTYSTPDVWATVFPYQSGGFFSKYEDPTSVSEPLGYSKSFSYQPGPSGCPYHVLSAVTDENGNTTSYLLDSIGRHLNAKITAPGGTLVQETDFTYDANFPGFASGRTVKGLGGPAWAGDLVTSDQLDADGRVQSETVNPGGLQITSNFAYDTNGNKISAQDPDGNMTWFCYDARNRLTTVVHQDGSMHDIEYDPDGNKLKEWDENGHETDYSYDPLNRLSQKTRLMYGVSPDQTTRYFYNPVNSGTMTIDPDGNVTTMQYDSLQRLTQKTEPAPGGTYYYSYSGANCGAGVFDSSGFKPTSITDPRGTVTGYTYDALYRTLSKSVGYAPGAWSSTTMQYDGVGNVTAEWDASPLHNETETWYDALNRPYLVSLPDGSTRLSFYTSTGLLWLSKDENGIYTETDYDLAGRPTRTIGDTAGVSATTQTVYDPAGNVTATINPRDYEWDYLYDVRNRKIQETGPAVLDSVDNAVERPAQSWQYDPVGNVTEYTDARGQATNKTWDAANQVLDVTAPPDVTGVRPVTKTAYDANGNVISVIDPNQHTTVNTYNRLNLITSSTDGAGIGVNYGYDPIGDRTRVWDGKQQRTDFGYDGLGRMTSGTNALGEATHYYYNGLNKTGRLDANGHTTNYSYDSRNRLAGVTYSDRPVDDGTYSYDPAGNLLSVVEPQQTAANVSYTYDGLNRVTSETSVGYTHSYGYDAAGNRTSTSYGGTGIQVASLYDALNRLSSMTEEGRTTTYGYDLNGNIVTQQFPNGDIATTSFDNLNRRIVMGTTLRGGNLSQFTLGYDLGGNLISQQEQYFTDSLSNRTLTNTYDGADRLVNEGVVQGTVTLSTTYTYDNANNRTTRVVTGGTDAGTTSYGYNAVNELTGWTGPEGSSTYTYDSDGNRVTSSKGSATYGYDDENRLISLTQSGTNYQYGYDYRTRRIGRTEAGVSTSVVFSGGDSIAEYTGTGTTPTVEYVRGSDWGGGVGGILYTLRNGGSILGVTHYDGRGDVTAKTDANGVLTYQAAYKAFGQRSQEYGSTLDRQKANTKEEDPSGLLDEGRRYRDMDTGTFITRDPAGFVDGPNLYTYVNQNPWTKFDPEGLSALDDLEKIGVQVIEHDEDGVAIVNGRRVRMPAGVEPGGVFHLPGELGEKYPNGVKFNKEGFPDFSPYSQKTVTIDMTGDNGPDFAAANKAAGYSKTPDGMTWHHSEDGKTMELIPQDLNTGVPHTGGAAIAKSAKTIATEMGLLTASIIAPNTTSAIQNGGNVAGAVVKDVGNTVSTPVAVVNGAVDAGQAAAAAEDKAVNQARDNWTEQQIQSTKTGIPGLDQINEENIRTIRPDWKDNDEQ